SSRRRHTRCYRDWSSDVCSSDLERSPRAIEAVRLAIEILGRPVYVRKEIVHNRHVVDELTAQGAVFVDALDEAPPGAVVVFSARSEERRVGKGCRVGVGREAGMR